MNFTLKSPLHVSNRQAVHPQEALLTVYADIGMYHAYQYLHIQSKAHPEDE